MRKYQEVEVNGYKSITFTDDDGSGGSIPSDPANSDYQEYLEHLTENPTEGDE